jgi:hypothetical protein
VSLTACGGGGGESTGVAPTTPPTGGGTAPPTSVAVGGIWQGSIPALGVSVIGLVTETGEFHFIQSDDVQYFGTLSASGSSLSGSYVGVTPIGFSFLDGSTTGTGTITGTVSARSSMAVQSTFRTLLNNTSATNFTLAYSPVYERPSALATIAGNYRDTGTGATINVTSAGVVFSQDATSGCIINGQVSIIDARYNAYRVEYSFASCRGADAVLNGTTARGLATLDNTVSPERAIIGVVNQAARYSYAGIFPRV